MERLLALAETGPLTPRRTEALIEEYLAEVGGMRERARRRRMRLRSRAEAESARLTALRRYVAALEGRGA